MALDSAESGVVLRDEWKPLKPFSACALASFETTHKLAIVAMSQRRGDYILADSRGKVFLVNPSSNKYELVKKATVSGPICCAGFVECKTNIVLLGYNSGSMIVFDMSAKRTLASLHTPSGIAPKMIRCHPTKSMAIVADANYNLCLWDLRIMATTLTLSNQEQIVDLEFIENGNMLVVVMENSGIHIYRTSDMKVALRCPFPDRSVYTAAI